MILLRAVGESYESSMRNMTVHFFRVLCKSVGMILKWKYVHRGATKYIRYYCNIPSYTLKCSATLKVTYNFFFFINLIQLDLITIF